MVDHRNPINRLVLIDSREVIVTAVIKQGEVIDRPSGNYLGDFPIYDFPGNRLGSLFADGNPPTVPDQLGDVV